MLIWYGIIGLIHMIYALFVIQKNPDAFADNSASGIFMGVAFMGLLWPLYWILGFLGVWNK